MHQELNSGPSKQRRNWKVPVWIAVSTLALGAPIATAAFVEDSDLTQVTQTVEDVFNINNGTWSNPGVDVVGEIADLTSGNFQLNDLLKTVLDRIKGAMGLPDPSEIESPPDAEEGTSEAEIEEGKELAMKQIKTVFYPEQAYSHQGQREAMSTAQVQAYIGSVLGKDGQQALANQIDQSQSYAETAQSGLQHMAQLSGASLKESQTGTAAASSGQAIAQRAQGRKMSQEVMKDNTALLAEMGKIDAAQSNQLSLLSNQASIQSGQLTAMSGQMGIGNQLLAQMRVGQAYQTIETTNISQSIAQLNEAERDNSRRTLNAVSRSIDMYNVPGFASLAQQGKL